MGVQSLGGELSRRLGGLHSRAILLHIELRVPHFNANLVFELVLAHLSLSIFQLSAHLVGLSFAVAQRYIQGQTDALIGGGSVNQLFQRASVTPQTPIDERRGPVRGLNTTCYISARTAR